MYILPVNQPYADLIIKGYKLYETRPTQTNIQGKIAIYANKKHTSKYTNLSAISESMLGCKEIDSCDIEKWEECCATDNYGVIIGTCEIISSFKAGQMKIKIPKFELFIGDYSIGRYAWQIENPVVFENPIPFKAHQGWNKVDDNTWNKMLNENDWHVLNSRLCKGVKVTNVL